MRTLTTRTGIPTALVLAVMLVVGQVISASAADIPQEARQGTKEYKAKDYKKATDSFRKAVIAAPDDQRWRYGLGLSEAQSGDLKSAQTSFESAAQSKDKKLSADALYNEGNVHLESKDYADAVKSYRESLLTRPGDPDAKRNLQIALAKLVKQQQQQQQQQKKSKNGKSKDSTDQKQNQKQQGDKNKDSKKNSQNKTDSTQNQQQQPDSTQQQQGDSLNSQQAKPDSTLSREQAERILKALADEEAKLRTKAQHVIVAPAPGGKDW